MTKTAVKEPARQIELAPAAPAPAGKPPAKRKASRQKASTAVAVADPGLVRPAASMTIPQMMGQLIVVSGDKSFDPAKAQTIADMILNLQNREESRAYDAAMLACQTELDDVIIKCDSYNEHTKSWWARLENISKLVDPIIRRHGFTLSYHMLPPRIEDHYLVACDVAHGAGHVRRYEIDVGNDSKGAKGTGTKTLAQGSISSTSYAHRALKVAIFDLKIAGMDTDGNAVRTKRKAAPAAGHGDAEVGAQDGGGGGGPAKISQADVEKLVEAIEGYPGDAGALRSRFLAHYKIEKISDLPANLYRDAMTAVANETKKAKEG